MSLLSRDDVLGQCASSSIKIHSPVAKSLQSLHLLAAEETDACNLVDNESTDQVGTDRRRPTGRAASDSSVEVKHPPLPKPASSPVAVVVGQYNARRGLFPAVGRVSAILDMARPPSRFIPKWECFICPATFNADSSLPVHIRAVHQDLWCAYERQHYADVCQFCREFPTAPFNLYSF